MLENKFNLIDEPWIPIVDLGKVSLREVFSNPDCRALGGNPIQKIALTKLLLAIAQAAYTPVDDEDWEGLGVEGLSQKCLAYLDQWHDRFYLYGERPFLQMRAIQQAAVQSLGAVLPQVATGNTTVLTQVQSEKNWIFQDSDKALLVLTLMGFCLGGKKTDNSIVLSPFYTEKNKENGKERSGISGSSLGFYGFMHNFIQGNSLLESLWLNLLTLENIQESRIYPNGLGSPPWQTMPEGEDCFISKSLKSSLMGRLIPLSKFCLFSSEGIHYSDGIVHSGYKEGVFDPSIAVNFSGKTPSAIWVDPEKRPWRQLTALLVSSIQGSSNGYDCIQLRYSLKKARQKLRYVMIWSGGLQVSNVSGEQYISGNNDFVESQVQISLMGESWLENLKFEMLELEALSKKIYMSVLKFFKSLTLDSEAQAKLASHLFWQLCERKFQALINACDAENSLEKIKSLRNSFVGYAYQVYEQFCPKETARQLEAWAKNRPNFSKYINS